MSRSGSSGSTRLGAGAGAFASSSLRKNTILALTPSRVRSGRLRLALEHEHRIGPLLDHLLADDHLLDVVPGADLVQQVQHRVLEDGTQAARPGASLERLTRHRPERALREAQPL